MIRRGLKLYAGKWFPGILFLLIVMVPAIQAENVNLDQKINDYLKPLLDEDLISGSILIARGDRVLVSKGFGPANREYNMPCTPHTRYRLASVSKQFIAAAIMILQEEGKLSVRDPLSKYLPDFPNGEKITLHHLLNHTSGVINYSKLKDHYRVWAMPHTVQQVIDRFKDEPLRFEPGARWEYSNSGYVLLTAVIEKISRMSYDKFLRQKIFNPLNMNESGVDSHTKVIPSRATGHYNYGGDIIQAPYLDMGFPNGAGALFSSVGDMFKWHRALRDGTLLSKKSTDLMFQPGPGDYGYGWFIRKKGEKTVIEHPGGLNGFLSSIKYLVEDDIVVISLFNYVSTFARRVNSDLVSMTLGNAVEPVLDLKGVKVEPEMLKKYIGTYRLQPGYDMTVEVKDGALLVTAPGEKGTVGIPQKKNVFFLKKDNAVVQFFTGKDSKPAMRLFQSERVFNCTKVH